MKIYADITLGPIAYLMISNRYAVVDERKSCVNEKGKGAGIELAQR